MSSKTAAAAQPTAPATEKPQQPPAVSLPETQTTTALALVTRSLTDLKEIATNVAALEQKYKGVVFDVKTTAGMKAACEARVAIRKPRYTIQTMQKDAKASLNSLKKAVDDQAEAVITRIAAIEDPVHEQISNEEKRKEEEKKAREEAERVRVAAIQARIEEIRQLPLEVSGERIERIDDAIKLLVAFEIDDTFAELKQQAEGAKATTLIRLRAAHTKARAFEDEQARLTQERAENERIRLENEARVAAQRAQLAEEERLARETRDREAAEARAAQELHASRMGDIHGIQQQVIIAQIGRLGVRKGGTIECIRETLAETEAWPITEGSYGPLTVVAQGAKDAAVKAIQELLAAAEVNAARAAEAARQAEDLRRQREESDRIERERQEARELEEKRLAAIRAAADHIEAQRREAAEAETRRLADERAQLERDQEALRVAQERAAAPVETPTEISPSIEQATAVEPPEPEPLLASIDFKELLAMQTVCRYAKEWAPFQDPDSKEDQKSDRKLAARAQEAAINLLVAVEALP